MSLILRTDHRPVREVVGYRDQGDDAFDELSCGHIVRCRRKAGGRLVVNHDEPCSGCTTPAIADPGASLGWRS